MMSVLMRRAIGVGVAVLLLAACEFRLTEPSAVAVPPASPPVITITNTNTNTNENDRSDTGPIQSPSPPTPTPTGPSGAALPTYGESVTRAFAAAHPHLVARSCQTTDGDGAWQFLDQLIAALRAHASDPRWGYLCKDASCSKVAADVVGYKADIGLWIVDVLGNHCPGPGDGPTQVRWGVLPFETARPWIGVRP